MFSNITKKRKLAIEFRKYQTWWEIKLFSTSFLMDAEEEEESLPGFLLRDAT